MPTDDSIATHAVAANEAMQALARLTREMTDPNDMELLVGTLAGTVRSLRDVLRQTADAYQWEGSQEVRLGRPTSVRYPEDTEVWLRQTADHLNNSQVFLEARVMAVEHSAQQTAASPPDVLDTPAEVTPDDFIEL
ncbi:hypothetical protein GCM10028784_30210 [Myceligenerans cantabricum]